MLQELVQSRDFYDLRDLFDVIKKVNVIAGLKTENGNSIYGTMREQYMVIREFHEYR